MREGGGKWKGEGSEEEGTIRYTVGARANMQSVNDCKNRNEQMIPGSGNEENEILR